jgi:nucleoside-diphosphate-sugar epimerase
MVFVSTVKVNGEVSGEKPFTEEDLPNPKDSYGLSKWEAEEALRYVASDKNLEVVIVRPPLVYGPGVKARFLRLIQLINRRVPLPVPYTENKRSLIGVDNLADFLVRCVNHRDAANEMFLVSDGEDVSTRELITKLALALGQSARFLPVPALALRLAGKLIRNEAAVDRLLGSRAINSDRARRTLGWTPPTTLDAGLAATAQWSLTLSKQLS